MLRKGFTLIELLIVITIIAILAGAAIPYVQDYVEDARISKVRADLDELRNALIRFELDRGAVWPSNATTTTDLVGPYIAKALADPWGTPYYINASSSMVFSSGPDRVPSNTDDIVVEFRPPLALSRAYWEDTNQDGAVSSGDNLYLRFTRMIGTVPAATGLAFSDDTDTTYTHAIQTDKRIVKTSLTTITVPFQPGRTLLNVTNAFTDTSTVPDAAKTNQVLIKAQ